MRCRGKSIPDVTRDAPPPPRQRFAPPPSIYDSAYIILSILISASVLVVASIVCAPPQSRIRSPPRVYRWVRMGEPDPEIRLRGFEVVSAAPDRQESGVIGKLTPCNDPPEIHLSLALAGMPRGFHMSGQESRTSPASVQQILLLVLTK